MNVIKFAALTNYLGRMGGLELTIQEIENIHQHIEAMLEPNKATCEAVDALLSTMGVEGKKIESIKAYRALTGVGLKESKDAVEKYWPVPANDPRQGKPEYCCRLVEITPDQRLRVESYVDGPSWSAGEIIYTSSVKLIDFDKGYAVTQNSVYRWK